MANRRELTANEAKFVRHVFRDSVNIENTEIVSRIWLSGGFTPYGGIKMDPQSYQTDYIGPDMYAPVGTPQPDPQFELAYLFLHELGHSWQHFTGAPMLHTFSQAQRQGRRRAKAAGVAMTAFNVDAEVYSYEIVPSKPDLLDYNMEQQCEIIADYFAHVMWKRPLQVNQWDNNNFVYPVATLAQLEGVLANFRGNPSYPKDGRWLWRARSDFRNLER